jgi:hypothetical protein
MEIDPQNYRELVAEIVQKFKDVNTELTMCKLSVSALKSQCSDLEQRLDAAVKSSARLQRATHEKYDIPLERLLERLAEASSDWDLLQQFQSLRASGPVN